MSINIDKSRKVINFDMITANLKMEFGEKNASGGYYRIRKFLEQAKFVHIQASTYLSPNSMTDNEVYTLYNYMRETLPWLEACARKIDVYNTDGGYRLHTYDENKAIARAEAKSQYRQITLEDYFGMDFQPKSNDKSFVVSLADKVKEANAAYANIMRTNQNDKQPDRSNPFAHDGHGEI